MTSEQPWVVLTPGRSTALALKAQVLAAGQSLGGLYFWTPGDMRAFLRQASANPATVAVREHLHLLLASLATGQEDASSLALARDPARLLRSLDQLHAAGHPVRELDFAPAEQLAADWSSAMAEAGWTTVQHFDWQLARRTPTPLLGGLLVLGFDAAHAELWPLLQAAVRHAEKAEVILTRPRSKAEDLDQAWVGTWEEAWGEAAPIGEESEPGTFASLAQRMENPEAAIPPPTRAVRVLIGREVREQACAVAAQCAAWLAEGPVTRMGILLPGPGPLARELSIQLHARELTHFDSFGHPVPPSIATRQWRTWAALQRSFRLPNLTRVLELSPALSPPDTWEKHVDRALSDMLVDELSVVAARLDHLGYTADATFLRRFAPLPRHTTLDEMLNATRTAWTELGWTETVALLEPQASAVAALGPRMLSASVFLDWLEAVAPKPAMQRDPESANPLARIHLLPYAQAEGLNWSHLIMADLNEGQWPPSFETPGYLGDDQITALNRSVLATGRQGEGHTVVKPGHALMLGPNERRALCRRQFYNLVESAREGLALTGALESGDGKGRIQPASDFLSHLYFMANEEPLSEAVMLRLHEATTHWLATLPAPATGTTQPQPAPIAQASVAYDARRQDQPFGRYECAFTNAPPLALSLSCKEWQDALVDPAAVWMKRYLGVEPARDDSRDRWPITRGSWVHAWLARALGPTANRFARRTHGADIPTDAHQAATRTRENIAASFKRGGREAPDWWLARWAEAEWVVRQFARRLADLEGWPWAATEWSLPKACEIPLLNHRLRLRGRLDLLLSQDEPRDVPECGWLADFKTGKNNKLSPKNYLKQFRQGQGVQLALYALALETCGAREVQISLLNAGAEVAPQISLHEVHEALPLWEHLAAMQESGVFGMRGELRTEFGRSITLPLATLRVEPGIWEEKWMLTHPALAETEESDDG